MKKIAVLMAVMLIAVSTVAATPVFQLGPLVSYRHSVLTLSDTSKLRDINSYGFGADARLNLFNWVSIDIPATYSFGDGVHTVGTRPSLNLNIPAANFIDIALGLAMDLDFQFDQMTKQWFINGKAVDQYSNAFLGATLAYRLALTFNIANFLSLSAAASVPMVGTFASFNGMPSWSETHISVAVLFNLF